MEHNCTNAVLNLAWNGTEVNRDVFHLLIYPCPCNLDGGCTKISCVAEFCWNRASNVLMCCLYKVFTTRNKISFVSILFGN